MDKSLDFQSAKEIWFQIQQLDEAGNINTLISTTVKNWISLAGFKDFTLRRILFYLNRCPQLICTASCAKLLSLDQNVIDSSLLKPLRKTTRKDAKVTNGRIWFPAVAADSGMMRELVVTKGGEGHMPNRRFWQLDRVGAAVCAVVEKRSGLIQQWNPKNYHFTVSDHLGAEDLKVKGTSMDLPLALALYSHMTGMPVPANLSATARVQRDDGEILFVGELKKKLETLERERHFIRRVLIAGTQADEGYKGRLKLDRVDSLKEALVAVFPESPNNSKLNVEINVRKEARKIKNLYQEKLLDTCIDNADGLLRHLEGQGRKIPEDHRIPAIFICYWRMGSCYCHKGDVDNTLYFLKRAENLYKKAIVKDSPLINRSDYLNSRVNFAVLLKDVFRYREAETIHRKLTVQMKDASLIPRYHGINLSSLSQLFLARLRYEEAFKYQKEALPLIPQAERFRNFAYLAQIYFRSGNFRSADRVLKRAMKELAEGSTYKLDTNKRFLEWYHAELHFRWGESLNKASARSRHFKETYRIAGDPNRISGYPEGLIHKFAGLAMLTEGDETGGLARLDRVVAYFNSLESPMFRLLGVTAATEKARYLLQLGEIEHATVGIRGIRDNLSIQNDIKFYFRLELKQLDGYLRSKKSEPAVNRAVATLGAVNKKIPY